MSDAGLNAGQDTLPLLISGKREVARAIWLFELQSLDGEALPPFEAGAHLLVRTPSGLPRRYSLCSAPSDRTRYQIGVKQEISGGGGSTSMVEDLRPRDILSASPPINYFPLAPNSQHTLLIAGGIGITPVLAMARHLHEQGATFDLLYCARSAADAAFIDVLSEPGFADRTTTHYDGGDPAKSLDFHARLATLPPGAHVYCCGPRPLMASVRDATRHLPAGTVHFEDFGAGADAGTGSGSFRIRLARSGAALTVAANETILAALRRHGLDVPSACEAGTCGTCRIGLIAGSADHRDLVLSDDERAGAIVVCVSRAQSEELTLDA